MRSLSDTDGVTLIYLNRLNVAEIGTWWVMPLRQSFTRLFLKNWSCFAVSEFWKRPEYDSLIFSYHFSSPTACLRLKGANCDIVSVKFGNDTLTVESAVRCDTLAVVDNDHFEPGNLYVMFTVLLLVFSVKFWL